MSKKDVKCRELQAQITELAWRIQQTQERKTIGAAYVAEVHGQHDAVWLSNEMGKLKVIDQDIKKLQKSKATKEYSLRVAQRPVVKESKKK